MTITLIVRSKNTSYLYQRNEDIFIPTLIKIGCLNVRIFEYTNILEYLIVWIYSNIWVHEYIRIYTYILILEYTNIFEYSNTWIYKYIQIFLGYSNTSKNIRIIRIYECKSLQIPKRPSHSLCKSLQSICVRVRRQLFGRVPIYFYYQYQFGGPWWAHNN